MIGFVFLIGSPVMANDFDNDVGIDYVVPSGDIVINQTTIESIELLPYEVTGINILEPYGKEVAFAEKHPLVGIATINYNTEYLPCFINTSNKDEVNVLTQESPTIINKPYNGNDELCIALSSQEVGFINTGYLVQYCNLDNSKRAIENYQLYNGYDFGTINQLRVNFMSAHTM